MAKNKLFRFAEITRMGHVLEPTFEMIQNDSVDYKGKWHERFFKNNNPITIELGCGKGEYSVGLARRYPNRNFVAVDIKGNRMYVGAREVENEGIKNCMFLRTKVELISHFFEKGEIDEIWLTFSDPQPKKPNKRLTSERFINEYRKILKPEGIIHLKTDSDILFEFTEEEIHSKNYKKHFLTWDVYGDLYQLPPEEQEILQIKTHYEELFTKIGAQIKYCKFGIDEKY